MFKMDEKTSDDGDIKGIIFMRPDGMFEGRIYRKPTSGRELSADFDLFVLTGTLAQARLILHEELGCNGDHCTYCRSP